MTIDNHPLTPKPIDDGGTAFQVTQADREAAELLQRAQAETFGGLVGGGDGGTYVVKTLSGKTLNDIRAFLARKALDTRP